MTSDGSNTYTWDARNQLSQFNAVSFQYDAAGRRTKNAAGTNMLYDGANSVQELSGTTPIANRITGGIDEFFSRTDGTGSYTPIADALGNVIGLVSSSGSVTTQYTYDPFGVTTAAGTANSNSFQYTGRENDGNGLYYYRARYYNPLIGRFISEDPIEDGDNFYAYAGNDPINFLDPTGLRDVKVYIWNTGLPSDTSVGHAEMVEMDGTGILSQFPDPHGMEGKNTPVPPDETLRREGRRPDYEFTVHVPDDAAFDKEVKNQKAKPKWLWMPYYTKKREDDYTNCVKAVSRALTAGGVPVPTRRYWWPGDLADDLEDMAKDNHHKKRWTVHEDYHLPPKPEVPEEEGEKPN